MPRPKNLLSGAPSSRISSHRPHSSASARPSRWLKASLTAGGAAESLEQPSNCLLYTSDAADE
eukprot:16340149-Heterocapsa_arctica.AAC.1